MSQPETSPIRIERIAHIVLFVNDPEASAKWYADVLNMKIVARAGNNGVNGLVGAPGTAPATGPQAPIDPAATLLDAFNK